MPAIEPTIAVISPDIELRRPVEHILVSRGYVPAGFCSTDEYLRAAQDIAASCIVIPLQDAQRRGAPPGWKRLTGEGMPPVVFITGLRTASLRTGSTALLAYFSEQVLAAVSSAKAVHQ
ncbi:hypothetical protein [Noviherbaspirillum sp. ST9]|uniref:hypothetical protein n=1 Tax=Noviherbaspirillum sp. ST9 TaxID=3401606 RepID=UPI003B58A7D7